MAKEESWSKRPLHKLVYDVITKHKSIYFNDLIEELKKRKINVDEDEVRTVLIKLEIWGYIDVFTNNKEDTYIALRG